MSGAVKAVTKTFKKITKSAVGKFIVAAGVSYFTAGLGASVLGATGFTGSATLGTVLSHAISGAATGGIMSAVSGGGIGKGLLLGAAGGAVMGGVQSALGNYTAIPGADGLGADSVSSAGSSATDNVSNAQNMSSGTTQSGAIGNSSLPSGPQSTIAPGGSPMSTAGVQNIGYTPAVQPTGLMPGTGGQLVDTSGWSAGTAKAFYNPSTGATTNITGTGRTGLMGWADRNPEIAGKVISEGATGALQAAVGGEGGGTDYAAATQARIAADQAEQLRIMGSHSGTGGLLSAGSVPQQRGGLLPSERWNTSDTGYSNGKWVYDPSKSKVVFVPNASAPAAA